MYLGEKYDPPNYSLGHNLLVDLSPLHIFSQLQSLLSLLLGLFFSQFIQSKTTISTEGRESIKK